MIGATKVTIDYTATTAHGRAAQLAALRRLPERHAVMVDRGRTASTSASGTGHLRAARQRLALPGRAQDPDRDRAGRRPVPEDLRGRRRRSRINGVKLRIPVREPQPPRARGLPEPVRVLRGRARLPRRRRPSRHKYGTSALGHRVRRCVCGELLIHGEDRLAVTRGGRLMATVEAPETLGIRPFDEFDGVYDVWPRGDRPDAIRDAARRFRARFATDENRVRAVQDRGPRVGRLSRVVRVPRRRQDAQPVHQHPEPPRDRAVRGLRGEPEDARLGADDRRGRRRGAVLRPAAEALRRVPLLQGVRQLLQHGRGGDRAGAASRPPTSTT